MDENPNKEPECPLCQGSGEYLQQLKRTMGYTQTGNESVDEKLVPCPLCIKNKKKEERNGSR